MDRLATLEPRTGLTRVWLSSVVSCKIKKELDILFAVHFFKNTVFFFSLEQ